jgi:hypothetical protein
MFQNNLSFLFTIGFVVMCYGVEMRHRTVVMEDIPVCYPT